MFILCTEPLYAIRLKTEFDKKFQRFGKRSPLRVLKAVRDIGKDVSKLNVDTRYYDILMISCGQCLQCRLLRSKQRAIMSICESLEHKDNCFVTLTFGYPQTYAYYRHNKGLSHYYASKKAHFHEWSLDTETFQKFMKRLRIWYYNFQLCQHMIKSGYSHFVPKSFYDSGYVTHLRLPHDFKALILKDFKPSVIRVMHCGEYGSKRQRPHHHCILHGFNFPDLKVLYEDSKKYYTSEILSKLWPFGIHRIGDCSYNSCAYVSRYVTKKINGSNQDLYYNGRKPEYVTYSTKPILGASYFLKNYKEFVNTQKISVISDKKYECSIPRSYDNLLKKIDLNLYNYMKEKRVCDSKTDLDRLLSSKRSIYSKLDSNQKICTSILRKLVRSYEEGAFPCIDEYLKKARAFGVSVKFFASEFLDSARSFLDGRNYKHHKCRNSNQVLHDKYIAFENARKRHISACYNVNHSDERVVRDLCFYMNMPNPFKVSKRGRSLPDIESVNGDFGIDGYE